MKTPCFSLLTTCYNKSPYLHDCISSVLGQSFDDWEWIVVDDTSSDDSYEVLKKHASKKICVVRNNNRMYCSSSYLEALKLARGRYCGILDADDALGLDAIKDIVKRYHANPELAYIYTQHFWCDANLKSLRTGISTLPAKSFAEISRGGLHGFSHWRTFRRDISGAIRVFAPGLKYAVDKHMAMVLEELGPGGFFPRKMYYYRYYPENMSRTAAKQQKQITLELARDFLARRRRYKTKVFRVTKIT